MLTTMLVCGAIKKKAEKENVFYMNPIKHNRQEKQELKANSPSLEQPLH